MTFRYKCSKCDEWHYGFPDLGYPEPFYAAEVPEAERTARLYLTEDLCVLDNQHFFVRCLLDLPVIGTDERFAWGVWSTLSEENFMHYQNHMGENRSDWPPMFGWLSTQLPHYPDTLSLKLSVQPQGKGSRPYATLETSGHPLAIEQRDGVSLDRVLEFVGPYLQPN